MYLCSPLVLFASNVILFTNLRRNRNDVNVSCAWSGSYLYAYCWIVVASGLFLVVVPVAGAGLLLHFSAHIEQRIASPMKKTSGAEVEVQLSEGTCSEPIVVLILSSLYTQYAADVSVHG